MNRKKWARWGMIGLAAIAAGIYLDLTETVFDDKGQLPRAEVGGNEKEVTLFLEAGETLEKQEYTITIPAALIGEDEAKAALAQAKEEIESSFWNPKESADHVTGQVFPKSEYVDGKVQAEWMFDDYDLISTEGILVEQNLQPEGSLIEAKVELTCGKYGEVYAFAFCGFSAEKSPQEALLASIQEKLKEQEEEEGKETLVLPQQVGDIPLHWTAKKSYYGVKILCIEGILALLLWASELEKAEEEKKKRRELLEMEYPEVVSKLAILMGSGMSLRQAWNTIVFRYERDRKQKKKEQKPALEEMLLTMREIRDGEQESLAYQKFGERCQVPCFWRLSRMLIQNQQKGTGGLCQQLTKESENAFEQRIISARKKGEEAGTKMLAPLMIMMVIVMAIILVPAVLQFSAI